MPRCLLWQGKIPDVDKLLKEIVSIDIDRKFFVILYYDHFDSITVKGPKWLMEELTQLYEERTQYNGIRTYLQNKKASKNNY